LTHLQQEVQLILKWQIQGDRRRTNGKKEEEEDAVERSAQSSNTLKEAVCDTKERVYIITKGR